MKTNDTKPKTRGLKEIKIFFKDNNFLALNYYKNRKVFCRENFMRLNPCKKMIWLAILFAVGNLSVFAAQVWQFDRDETAKQWRGVLGLASAPVFHNGAMELDLSKTYAAIAPKAALDFTAENRYLLIRLRAPKGTGAAICYFGTDSDRKLSEKKKLYLQCRFTGQRQELILDFGRNPNWKGRISRIRLDFELEKPGRIELFSLGILYA